MNKLDQLKSKIKGIDILDLIVSNNEVDDYSVNDIKTLENWNNKIKEILGDSHNSESHKCEGEKK